MSKIFALDIGTRKVAGLLATRENGTINILDCEVREHQTRAMLAGQIHDVDRVAAVVQEIKTVLEQRQGEPIGRVAVAVAGRTLRTLRGQTRKNIIFENEITASDVLDLELAAVQQVLNNLGNQPEQDLAECFYCVGYSVVSYFLDQEKIDNLVGQKGYEIGVEIIATFLPRIVLESMFTVLKKTGLEVSSLTLEPIAAINAIIPPDMRRLNLALVDIGAGTSDIAITTGGSVNAYGMVPSAGDMITEKLCDLYLLDFCVGENIKRLLSSQSQIEFTDIFGKQWSRSALQILSDLTPAIEELAATISEKIIDLNQTAPSALVCVGGGSLTPLLQEKLARVLHLPRERVGVRGPELISWIHNPTGKLTGPEAITPLGITSIATEQQGLQFVNITVNGKHIHLLNINQRLNILSALLASGISTKKMHSRPGLSKTFELNGELRIIQGTLGKPATVLLNNIPASLEDPVSDHSQIIFEEAQDGQDGQAKISDFISLIANKKIVLNSEAVSAGPAVYMNNEPVHHEAMIPDLAKIEIKADISLRALLRQKFDVSQASERSIVVTIDNEPRIITQQNFHLAINGQEASLEAPLQDGDIIEYTANTPRHYQLKDVVPEPITGRGVRVYINGQEYTIEGQRGKIMMNGQEVSPDEFIINGADIRTIPGKNAELIVVDLLRYITLDVDRNAGKKLKMFVNGREASFTTALSQGAEVKLYFE
ncbi:MAG: ATPase [bacterium]|nr:ATPase [bacterium]MDD5354518.1 ATPase [bacterium]MDD5756443.1 ATPase [bacterium]